MISKINSDKLHQALRMKKFERFDFVLKIVIVVMLLINVNLMVYTLILRSELKSKMDATIEQLEITKQLCRMSPSIERPQEKIKT